jgi:hypothetical protein
LQTTAEPWCKPNLFKLAVEANGPNTIGGGGEPRQPLAPDFIPFTKLFAKTDGTPGAEIYPTGTLNRLEGHEYVIKVITVPNGHSFSHWQVTSGAPIVEDSLSYELHLWLTDLEAGVEAVFVPDTFELSTIIKGSGKIVLSPEEEKYAYGTKVELFADPDSAWSFAGWAGSTTSLENPLEIIIHENTYIEVLFEELNTSISIEAQKRLNSIGMLYDSGTQSLVFHNPTS